MEYQVAPHGSLGLPLRIASGYSPHPPPAAHPPPIESIRDIARAQETISKTSIACRISYGSYITALLSIHR